MKYINVFEYYNVITNYYNIMIKYISLPRNIRISSVTMKNKQENRKRRGEVMHKVTSKELLIISHLRHNARLKLTKLSRLTQIPVSTIFDRIKTGSKLVQKHTTLIDFQQLGFTVRAHVILKVRKEEREALHDYLMKHKHINNAYRINNGYDFLVEGIFKHLKELEDFLEGLEGGFKIKARQVYYIIDDLKREAFLSNPEYLQMIMGEE